MNDIDVAAILYKAADAVRQLDVLTGLPSCQDCGRKDCKHKPLVGQWVRYNCYDWKPQKEGCKYLSDEFDAICTNADSPARADACPCLNYPEVCKHAEIVK